MGTPATTARVTPPIAGFKDGFSTKIAFAADSNVTLWEKTVKPPGVDGGDPIETTTMFNATYRTMAARSLKTLTNGTTTCAYHSSVLPQIVALINVEGAITIHFPDGSTWDFFGYLKSFEPQEHVEGEQPTANCEFVCTNVDPSDDSESAPVYTAAGT
jgi:hypothetical protein